MQVAMLRCAFRDSGGADDRNPVIGLRCARSLQ
jgi:formylglycine-generating enzyme required for sulfatase activity